MLDGVIAQESYDHLPPTIMGGVASAGKLTKSKGLDGVIA
jgi:hypothetical protein